VAGAAALVESASGGAAGWDALTSALVSGARPSGMPVGAGTLDIGGALRKVIPGAQWRSPAAAAAPAKTTKKATTTRTKKASSKKRAKRSAKARTARRHKAKKAKRHTTRRKATRKVRAHVARAAAPRGSRHLRHVVYRAA
jgi:hypothetical protein